MEGQENEIMPPLDVDENDDDFYSSDSDDEEQQQSYQTAVRVYSRCSKRELKRLLKSTDSKDQKALDKIVVSILLYDNDEAFNYLLSKSHNHEIFDKMGETIFHRAYYFNALSILTLLYGWQLDNSKRVEHVDGNKLSYLHIASFAGNERSIQDCLKSSSDVNAHYKWKCGSYDYTRDIHRDGFTPLHFATINYKAKKVMMSLLDNGADVNAVDSLNRTPLHIACLSYETPSNFDDFSMTYVGYSSIDAMEILVEYKSDVDAKDNCGNTPLLSIFPDNFRIFESTKALGFIESIPVHEIKQKLKFLLKQRVDVTACNVEGDNILHLIVRNLWHWRCSPLYFDLFFDVDLDHHDMIKQIFEIHPKFDVNAKNNEGETPLQLAVSSISSLIVKILLEHGADLSNIEFDYRNSRCFEYPKILPDLDAVQNLISMVELMMKNNWELTLEGNLAILQFLVHDVEECQCRSLLDVLNLGSVKHINQILNKEIDDSSESQINKNRIVVDIKQYLISRLIIATRKDIEVLQALLVALTKISVEITIDENSLLDFISEKFRMQVHDVHSNFTIHDMMLEHPNDIYNHVKDYDFQTATRDYAIYENIIKGHVAKAFIRHYLENSVYAYLKHLSFGFLPYICCKRILHYLDNEDILHMCLATILSDC